MKTGNSVILILVFSMLASCGLLETKPKPVTEESFLTLADVVGRTSLREDSPDVRVINLKAKAFIKKNDVRAAKRKAVENGAKMAVETMVRELMTAENYNRRYEEIGRYMSKNVDKYIVDRAVNAERRIYLDKFYGVSASFKVSRQKVLVALQKDLKLIDAGGNTLVTVITSKKDLDLSSIGIRFSDIEDALMNQIQTDLNQRGLHAMDFRNAVAAMQTDPKAKGALAKISKRQFMAMVSGSKGEDVVLDQQVRNAEEFYATGLSILKQMAKVVVEVNIISVSKTGSSTVLNLNVTAKNISVGTGGAIANTVVQVARRAGPDTDDSAILTALIKDAYGDMNREFIPQIIKEMSTIDVGGNKLVGYELVMKGFTSRQFRSIRKAIESSENDGFRFIDFDNTLQKAEPSINRVFVRYAGKTSRLGDRIMDIMDGNGQSAEEPIVAPGLTDLVFEKSREE
ncbi:MAG: hypothetical protein GY866_09215 [Proteobacteria bacterium]|nr:hypothetical protein [Pseudomonadota bacterium]